MTSDAFSWSTEDPMTLEDIKVFTASAEAFGADMQAPVKVRVTLTGKLREIRVPKVS